MFVPEKKIKRTSGSAQADAVQIEKSDGSQVSSTNPFPVVPGSESLTKTTATAGSVGDTTVYTPSSGKKIRLYFFGYSGGSNVTGVLVGLKFGSGSIFDRQYLSAAGQPYARNIQAGKRYIDGAVDEPLKVNLDVAQTVYVNIELEEVS